MIQGHVFTQAKERAVRKPDGKLESLVLSQRIHTSLDYTNYTIIRKYSAFILKTHFARPLAASNKTLTGLDTKK